MTSGTLSPWCMILIFVLRYSLSSSPSNPVMGLNVKDKISLVTFLLYLYHYCQKLNMIYIDKVLFFFKITKSVFSYLLEKCMHKNMNAGHLK